MHIWTPNAQGRRETIGIMQTGTDAYPIWNDGAANTKPAEWDYMSSDGGTDSISQVDYQAITVNVHSLNALADFCLDIAIDTTTTGVNCWNVVQDLRLPGLKTIADYGWSIYIPVHIPKGSRIRQRAMDSTGAKTGQIAITGHETGVRGAPGYRCCIPLFTPSSSRGVTIDPGGTANTKGSYAQLIASTPANVGAILGIIGHNTDVARAANARLHLDLAKGGSGSEQVFYPNFSICWSTTGDNPTPNVIPCCSEDIPAGTRIAARAQCSVNTGGDRTIDLALYGLVE